MATTIWKGHLTFGLVSIPVRLFKASRPEKISFHQLHKAKPAEVAPRTLAPAKPEAKPQPAEPQEQYTRVHQKLVADDSPAPIARNEVVKGFEYEKDRYVVIDNEDLKKLAPPTGTEMQIQAFVKLSEVDPVYFDASYYLAPDEAGEKAYSLLFAAMRDSGYMALAEAAMHRREHVIGIRPGARGLIAHTLFYSEEIRRDQEFRADISGVNAKEVQLAKLLVDSMAEAFEPQKYKNKYREKVQQLIDAKLAGKDVAEAPEPKKGAEVVDIMAALQSSLNAMKKPASAAPSKRNRASGS